MIFLNQVGESYRSEDCSKEFVCKADGKFEEKAAAKCHKDATCSVKGQRGCHCKQGLKGDGVTKCESKTTRILCSFETLVDNYICQHGQY